MAMATVAALSSPSILEPSALSSSASISTVLTWKRQKNAVVLRGALRVIASSSRLEESSNEEARFDRRELIAASVAGLSLFTPSLSHADPIGAPDLSKCGLATVNPPSGSSGTPAANLLCCVPSSKTPAVDWVLDKIPPKHLRRAAHKVDASYIAKYNEAYRCMRALPATDPRSLKQQADVHCAFCNGAYSQSNSSKTLQVHFSWLFLPWHRWYLYFHERILADLIGDPTFSLLYWNWADQTKNGGNVLPNMFLDTNTYPSLYDPKRNQTHLPPTIINLIPRSSTTDPNVIIQENLNQMYQTVVTTKKPTQFMGGSYKTGDDAVGSNGGTLENGPHTGGHAWTGDPNQTYRENMGNFYSAGRDPIFYSHHSNVDRIWTVWNRLGGQPHDSPDFLNAQFLFYDEKAKLVKVSLKDALDSEKLGISYDQEPSDDLWINYNPQPLPATRTRTAPIDISKIPRLGPAASNPTRTDLGTKFLTKIAQPPPPPTTRKATVEKEEVLILEGLELPVSDIIDFVVFINLPEANQNTPATGPEYVGSFTSIPHGSMDANMVTSVRFSIGDNLRRLGITDTSDVVVTVVRRGEGVDIPVKIKGARIDYD